MRVVIAGALVLTLAGTSRAQVLFRADLGEAAVVPPTASSAGGCASFVLNADDTLTYTVQSWLVTGTTASINSGAVGANGPVLFPLTGGPDVWSGTTAALSLIDRTNFRAGGFYVEIDSAAFPGGELRGQIVPMPMTFGAHLTGDQVTPPVVTSAVGDATFVVNADKTITYDVTTSGLTGTAAHIHFGKFGSGGFVIFGLSGGPTRWSGTTVAMTGAQYSLMQTEGLYVNVHTAAHPSLGEIRGQIVPTEVAYGLGRAGSVGVASMHAGGAAMRGGTLMISIAGGLPGGSGLLILSLAEGASAIKTCPYLLGPPLLIVPVPLDGAGGLALQSTLPDLPNSIDLYLEYFGFDPNAPNGALYSTNAVLVPIFDY